MLIHKIKPATFRQRRLIAGNFHLNQKGEGGNIISSTKPVDLISVFGCPNYKCMWRKNFEMKTEAGSIKLTLDIV